MSVPNLGKELLKITPEMIEAGSLELVGFDWLEATNQERQSVLEAVFSAMHAVFVLESHRSALEP